jgi:hypothetical protein
VEVPSQPRSLGQYGRDRDADGEVAVEIVKAVVAILFFAAAIVAWHFWITKPLSGIIKREFPRWPGAVFECPRCGATVKPMDYECSKCGAELL